MRDKYIDEIVGRYFIFGESRDGKFVDVADQHGDLFTKLPRHIAQQLIEAHDRFRNEAHKILADLDWS